MSGTIDHDWWREKIRTTEPDEDGIRPWWNQEDGSTIHPSAESFELLLDVYEKAMAWKKAGIKLGASREEIDRSATVIKDLWDALPDPGERT